MLPLRDRLEEANSTLNPLNCPNDLLFFGCEEVWDASSRVDSLVNLGMSCVPRGLILVHLHADLSVLGSGERAHV